MDVARMQRWVDPDKTPAFMTPPPPPPPKKRFHGDN
jgi:hypothetical protein